MPNCGQRSMTQRARIGNGDLAFYENNIAAALSIVQRMKALTYWMNDPEELTLAVEIIRDAHSIRDRNRVAMKAAQKAAKEAA